MEAATRWVPDEMGRAREEFEDATGERGWYPWDALYAQQLRAPMPETSFPGHGMLPAVLRGVRAWGIPSSLLRFRVDYHDLPAGGISLAPDPPRDVRVVVHPEGGWERYGILFRDRAAIGGRSPMRRGIPGPPGGNRSVGLRARPGAESRVGLPRRLGAAVRGRRIE
ncbi:MAG: hypothetical protein L3J92_03845 [Thermoplasmata archaeon]|nr:hypothetical protein [Thermoplasmata archaeon]